MAGVAILGPGVEGLQQSRHGGAGGWTQLAETAGRIDPAGEVVVALQEPGEQAGGKRCGPAQTAAVALSTELERPSLELPHQPLHRETFGRALTPHQSDQNGRNGQPWP